MRSVSFSARITIAIILCGVGAVSQDPPVRLPPPETQPTTLPNFDQTQQQWNIQTELNKTIQQSNDLNQLNQGLNIPPDVRISANTVHAAIPPQELERVVIPAMQASLRAAPGNKERAASLRSRINTLALEIRDLGSSIIANGVADIALKERNDLETVQNYDKARQLLGELREAQKELEKLAPDDFDGRTREQDYLNSLPVGSAPSYAVQVSDSTSHGGPPLCEDHSYITYEKVLKDAGFDSKGTPVRKWDYDTVSHRYQVCK